MAMRPRSRFGNQPYRPPVRQANENFKPRSEWKYENDVTLLVYLRGFVREQIRVMFTYVDESSLAVRVQGQRSIGMGRWSQFSEVYRIPDTCDASKISTLFDRGVLTVVMPKLIVSEQKDQFEQVAEHKPAGRDTSPSPQRTAGDKKSTAQTSEAAEKEKPREEKKLVEAVSTQKATSEEKSQKGEDKTSPKAAADKPREEKKDEAVTTQDVTSEDEPSRKALEMTSSEDETSPKEMEKQKDGALTTEKATSKEKSQKDEDETSPKVMEKLPREEKNDGALTTEKATSEEKSQKGKDESASSKAASWDDDYQKQSDDEKEVTSAEAIEKAADESEMPENNNVGEKAEVQSKESAAASDSAVTSKTGEIKHKDGDEKKPEKGVEGKPLLINTVVALFVVMGLGAYITYKITSSF